MTDSSQRAARVADSAYLATGDISDCLLRNSTLSVTALEGKIRFNNTDINGRCCAFHCTVYITVPRHRVIRLSHIHVTVASCDDMTVEVRDVTKRHHMLYWTCWRKLTSRVLSSSNGVIIDVIARRMVTSALSIEFSAAVSTPTPSLEITFTTRMKGKHIGKEWTSQLNGRERECVCV